MRKSLEFLARQFNASQVVDDCMTDYAKEVAKNKLPHVVDGLKVIHRRILWVMYHNKFFAPPKNILSSVMGRIIEQHPVGNQSINEACVRMSQAFSLGIPLLDAKGNNGNYSSVSAGADRYLHVALSKLANDLFFEGVNIKTFPMVPDEKLIGYEPGYFIPRLPTSLLCANFTVGVGIKANVFPMHLDNVCELVKKYADWNANNKLALMDFSKLGRYFIPDFPIRTFIRNVDTLVDKYNKNDFSTSIYIDSNVEIYKNKIIIKSVPFGQSFADILNTLKKCVADNKHWLSEVYTDFHNGINSKTEGAIEITFKQTADIFEIFKRLTPMIHYASKVTPIYNFANKNGYPIQANPPLLVDVWYRERRNSILGGIKYDQEATSKLIREKEVRLLIRGHADEVISIVKDKAKTEEECIALLQERFTLSYNQAVILINSNIKSLNKQSEQELKADIERLEKKAIDLKEQADNADSVIFKDAEYFQRKYKRPRISKITEYQGFITVGDKNIIQWDSISEACTLISNFPGCKCYTYPDKWNYRYMVPSPIRQARSGISISKITEGQHIFAYPTSDFYTLWIKGTKPACTEGFFTDNLDGDKLTLPMTKQFYGIETNGNIIKCKTTELLVKRANSRHKTEYSLRYAVPYFPSGVVIILVNDHEPNLIRFIRIDQDTKTILLSPLGKTEIIGYIPVHSSKPCIFNVPDIVKGSYSYILIQDIESIIGSEPSVVHTITRKTPRNDVVRSMIEL